MRSVWVFVALLAVVLRANAVRIILTSEEGNEYFVQTDNKASSWSEAKAHCETLSMQLVAIETEEKQNEIKSMLKLKFAPEALSEMRFWTSGRGSIGLSSTFVWITSFQQADYKNFLNDLPSWSAGHDRCTDLRGSDFLWDIESCEQRLGYICQARTKNYQQLQKARKYENRQMLKPYKQNEKNCEDLKLQIKLKTAESETLQNELAEIRKACEEAVMLYINTELEMANLNYSLGSADLEHSDKRCIDKQPAELTSI